MSMRAKPKRGTAPRIGRADIVAVVAVGIALLGSGGVVGASSLGVFSDATGQLDVDSYSLPDPTAAPPEPGASGMPSTSPSQEQLTQAINAVSRTGVGTTGIAIGDVNGGILVEQGASQPMIPASNMKILTAATVLTSVEAERRFVTSVVMDGTTIILVGGGDPYLSSTADATADGSLARLADLTASALAARGVTSVALGLDDTYFTGPSWHPSWIDSYHLDVSPISALCVDSGVISRSQRSTDCTTMAGAAFSRMLTDRGILVTSQSKRSGAGMEQIASVESQRLGLLVQRMLSISDNTAAEVLLRQAALASGQQGSFTGEQTALRTILTELGVWQAGMNVDDGSGLSRSNKVTPAGLVATVSMALRDPIYADLLDGLPVSAVDGTLSSRFDDTPEQAGRGVVHAKTGSLIDVRTMSGYILTNSGGIVVVSMLTNDVPAVQRAMNWLDSTAAAIAAT